MYRLKSNQENFTCVDGPLAGRKFERGRIYDEVPAQDAHRFEAVEATPAATVTKMDKKAKAPAADIPPESA